MDKPGPKIIPVSVNESAWLPVLNNRGWLGKFIEYENWDRLVEFWRKDALPEILKAQRALRPNHFSKRI